MLRHESCCTGDNNYATSSSLASHSAQGNFANIRRSHEVDFEDTLRRLLELAMLIKIIVKIIAILRYSAIGNHDVDPVKPAERGEQFGP
jgi:hypothetical protein